MKPISPFKDFAPLAVFRRRSLNKVCSCFPPALYRGNWVMSAKPISHKFCTEKGRKKWQASWETLRKLSDPGKDKSVVLPFSFPVCLPFPRENPLRKKKEPCWQDGIEAEVYLSGNLFHLQHPPSSPRRRRRRRSEQLRLQTGAKSAFSSLFPPSSPPLLLFPHWDWNLGQGERGKKGWLFLFYVGVEGGSGGGSSFYGPCRRQLFS